MVNNAKHATIGFVSVNTKEVLLACNNYYNWLTSFEQKEIQRSIPVEIEKAKKPKYFGLFGKKVISKEAEAAIYKSERMHYNWHVFKFWNSTISNLQKSAKYAEMQGTETMLLDISMVAFVSEWTIETKE